MADLVDKFYSVDLSPGEEEALDDLLSSSPEAANRFAEKAAEAYSRYGLPDLGPHSHPGKNSWWRLRLGLLFFVLVSGGGFGWWRHHQNTENPSPEASGIQASVPASGLSGLKPGRSDSVIEKTITLSRPPQTADPDAQGKKDSPIGKLKGKSGTLSDSPSRQPEGFSGSRAPLSGPPPTAGQESKSLEAGNLSPLPQDHPATRGYARLKINVDISQAGPVTVCILNSAGIKVKDLYAGTLPAGERSFTWDGKLDDGRKAQPGSYRIETHSGNQVQTQDFQIEQKKK